MALIDVQNSLAAMNAAIDAYSNDPTPTNKTAAIQAAHAYAVEMRNTYDVEPTIDIDSLFSNAALMTSTRRSQIKAAFGVHPEATTRYAIIEVEGILASNGGQINELKFFDNQDALLPYTTTAGGAYDDRRDAVPLYWTSTTFGRSKLNDGVNTVEVSSNGCLFMHPSTPTESDNKARFIVDFGVEVTISSIEAWSGGYNNALTDRCIETLNLYKVDEMFSGSDPELNNLSVEPGIKLGSLSWIDVVGGTGYGTQRTLILPS